MLLAAALTSAAHSSVAVVVLDVESPASHDMVNPTASSLVLGANLAPPSIR